MCVYVDIFKYIIYIYISPYICFWWCCFDTTKLTGSRPPLSLGTADTRRNICCPQENAKEHENRRNNLEPTPPLKCIYTPTSIKVLFPLDQSKSLFRKFTTNSIKKYTSQCNKNMMHNLSDHTLTEDEFSVLTKGLSFVPTPTKTFQKETNKTWNKFKTRMLTQYFFRNNIHDKISPFKKKPNWTLPPSDNPTLTNFFTRTEQGLISVNTVRRKTYSNLILQEK